MLTVYVTCWVSGDVFQGNPDITSPDFVEYQDGVAWGSFCFAILSIFSAISKVILYRLTRVEDFNRKLIKLFYMGSLIIGAVPVIIAAKYPSQSTYFIFLSFTGFALETFHVIPGILADIVEYEELGQHLGKYRHLLGFSLFYAQVLMFCVVPLFFLLNPDRDDNEWGMLASGSSMLAGGVLGWFI